ncbi:hypothetical protein LCGC14_0870880 [marine sediment metagenome]|uniref:Uncharacterized protein n=1 Tax=marine sediment metagenome TaxID=412755 RepID=A0A0F9P9N0_9ZZZZ
MLTKRSEDGPTRKLTDREILSLCEHKDKRDGWFDEVKAFSPTITGIFSVAEKYKLDENDALKISILALLGSLWEYEMLGDGGWTKSS